MFAVSPGSPWRERTPSKTATQGPTANIACSVVARARTFLTESPGCKALFLRRIFLTAFFLRYRQLTVWHNSLGRIVRNLPAPNSQPMRLSAIANWRTWLATFLVVLSGLSGATNCRAESAEVSAATDQAAVAAMKRWLGLVDRKDYAASYSAASGFFRKSITQREWVDACRKVRGPFGNLTERKCLTSSHLPELSDGTKGPFVIAQFQATFEDLSVVIETVTFQLESGKWKASGYYLRPGP